MKWAIEQSSHVPMNYLKTGESTQGSKYSSITAQLPAGAKGIWSGKAARTRSPTPATHRPGESAVLADVGDVECLHGAGDVLSVHVVDLAPIPVPVGGTQVSALWAAELKKRHKRDKQVSGHRASACLT